MQAIETLLHCWWECKLGQLLWKTICHYVVKLNVYSRESLTHELQEVSIAMFPAVLFIIVTSENGSKVHQQQTG
jgi:hypothetical protein